MTDTYRLKIQFQGQLFEAEGDRETVNDQFRTFQEMIRSVSPIAPNSQPPPPDITPPNAEPTPETSVPFNDEFLGMIMKKEDRVISLTVRPASVQEALLVLLYGHRVLRQVDLCGGAELLSGLVVTGGYSITRVDRVLYTMSLSGELIITGEHRSKKYRLANIGITKARQIASDLLAKVT